MKCTGSLSLLQLNYAQGVSCYFSKETGKTETCEDSSTLFSHAIKAYGVLESRVPYILNFGTGVLHFSAFCPRRYNSQCPL